MPSPGPLYSGTETDRHPVSEAVQATLDPQALSVKEIRFKSGGIDRVELRPALVMGILFKALKEFF